MGYGLPKTLEICGEEFPVRYDFRVILEIFQALNDGELDDQERGFVALQLFYPDFDEIPDYREAISKMFWFINGGKEQDSNKRQRPLVDWEQDFPLIVAPVNRVLGYETRAVEYDPLENTGGLHWWTFLSAYMEIGDCLFSQVVGIRSKKARGKALDKADQEFYRRNKDIVDIKTKYTREQNDLLKEWGIK